MFQKNLKAYVEMCSQHSQIKLSDLRKKEIINHLLKSHVLVLFFIRCYLYLLGAISLAVFRSHYYSLSYSKKVKIRNYLKIFDAVLWFIDNLFYVIISTHEFGNENIHRIKSLESISSSLENNDYFEFLVIGSGPAGSVTAAKISEKYPGTLALLERGQHFSIPQNKHPGEEFSKKWKNGGILSTFGPEMISFASGNCLGGGSEINSGLFHEPDEKFFKSWSDTYGIRNLNIEDMKPFLKEVKEITNLDQNSDFSHFENTFKITAKKLGLSWEKLNRFMGNTSPQRKNSMTQTYLEKVVQNNGKIFTNSNAKKIFAKKGLWNVILEQNGVNKVIQCKNLFLCCGAIQTNSLLLNSPVSKGKRKTIRKFYFHPMLKVLAKYPDNIQKMNSDITPLQITEYYPNYIIGNAASSLQFQLMPFHDKKYLTKLIRENFKKSIIFHATFSLGVGKIYNVPFMKDTFPLYFINRNDKNLINTGFKTLVSFIKKSEAEYLIPLTKTIKNPIYLKADQPNITNFQHSINHSLSSVHVMGGVTSGENKGCVVDSYGQFHGQKNLFVNDSSLINTKLLKNPQGTVLSIALRNVDYFLRNY